MKHILNYWQLLPIKGAIKVQREPFDFENIPYDHFLYAITEEGSELDRKYKQQLLDNK
jgi:hypothetical protein